MNKRQFLKQAAKYTFVIIFLCIMVLNSALVPTVRAELAPSTTCILPDCIQTDNRSYWPVISADGRYVVFGSVANNLYTRGPNDYRSQAYVHDIQTGTNSLVSANSNGDAANGGVNYPLAISADGRYVAFASDATNLVSQRIQTDFPMCSYEIRRPEQQPVYLCGIQTAIRQTINHFIRRSPLMVVI